MLTSSGLLGSSPSKHSKSLSSSPEYQTFPSLARANQSSMSSTRSPSLTTWSLTTIHVTPAISFVWSRTSTVLTSVPP